nr:MAG TPA: hypothetical protein [Caudoviricetes sp.]
MLKGCFVGCLKKMTLEILLPGYPFSAIYWGFLKKETPG